MIRSDHVACNGYYHNQVCSAGSKVLVQETIYERFIGKLKERMTHMRVGNQLDKAIDMGALVDQSQMRTISEFVQSARDEGADVYQAHDGELPKQGFFYPPTLITNVQTVSRVVAEEVGALVLKTPSCVCCNWSGAGFVLYLQL